MGNFIGVLILSLAAALQATFIPQIRLAGGSPDLVYLLVVAWAIHSSLEEGVFWAFTGGILQDLISITPIGTSSIGMLLTVFVISGIGQQVYRIGLITLTGIILVGTLIQQLIVALIIVLNGTQIDWLNALGFVVAPTIFYNLMLIWPIYWFVRRIQRRIY